MEKCRIAKHRIGNSFTRSNDNSPFQKHKKPIHTKFEEANKTKLLYLNYLISVITILLSHHHHHHHHHLVAITKAYVLQKSFPLILDNTQTYVYTGFSLNIMLTGQYIQGMQLSAPLIMNLYDEINIEVN